jgi:hypothetical protein
VGAAVYNPSPASRYGSTFLGGGTSQPGQATALAAVAGPSDDDQTSPFHPDHPVFWLGVILAGAVGLAYFSTTVRVGPASASASVGKK